MTVDCVDSVGADVGDLADVGVDDDEAGVVSVEAEGGVEAVGWADSASDSGVAEDVSDVVAWGWSGCCDER